MKKRVTTLVLDMGGVLGRPQNPRAVRRLMDELGLDGDLERFRAAYFAQRDEYDRGALDLAGYWGAVCAALGVDLPEGGLPRLLRADMDGWFEYRLRMIEAAAALRPRLRSMAILSNMNREGAERLRATLPRIELFDRLFLSCDLGLMKPELAIYERCVAGLGAQAGECLFVDDTPANVAAARAAGMSAIRFIDEEQCLAELETFYEPAL